MARAARAETLARAGVVAAAAGPRIARARRRAVDVPFHDAARRLGHAGIEELLEANPATSNQDLGELLGVSANQAYMLRRRFGFSSPGRWAEGYVPTSRAARPRVGAAELAAIPPGVQPERHGELLCRDCGRWVRARGLSQHLAGAHKDTLDDYRRRHGLDPLQDRAAELGHPNVAELLAAHAHLNGPDLAALLDVDLREARELRRRHGYRTPRGRTPATLMTDAELAALPQGVQPEQDGKLLCRECGRWYRGLAQHVAHKHAIGPADYRERHGLAAGHCLQAEDLHDKRVAIGRARWDGDEEWRERFRAGGVTTAAPEQLALAQAGRRASAARAGSRAALLASGERVSRVRPQRIAAEFTRLANALSYDTVEEMLSATADLTGRELARLLGVADHRAYSLRQRHGHRSPGRAGRRDGAVVPAEAAQPRFEPPEVRSLPCLECGRRYLFLGKHVAAAHQLSPQEYRRRHGLPADLPLHAHNG